jgi:hypothetical protein
VTRSWRDLVGGEYGFFCQDRVEEFCKAWAAHGGLAFHFEQTGREPANSGACRFKSSRDGFGLWRQNVVENIPRAIEAAIGDLSCVVFFQAGNAA